MKSATSLHLLVFLSSSACAAELDELLALPLDDLSRLKLTTSTMTEETLRTVPSAMSVYTHEELRRLGITELQQLATLVPGFQLVRTDDWGISYVFTNRGRPITDGMRSILVLVDGQRLNGDGTGSLIFDHRIPLDTIERVEFIRGPGSALYGTNAVSAVINIITRSEREIRAEAGNHAERGASAQWRFDGKDKSLELFARGMTANGETTSIFNPATKLMIETHDPYTFHDLSLRAKLGEFTLSARNAHRLGEQFYVYGYVDNTRNRRTTDSANLNLDWQHRLDDTLSLQGNLWHNWRSVEVTTNVGIAYSAGLKENELGTQWVLRRQTGSQRWLIGTELRQPRITKNANQFGAVGPEDARTIEGLFGQFQTDLVHDLALTTGLRFDHYSDFGSHLSPRAGLVWQAMPQDTFKLLYSEAFRAPSRNESSTGSGVFSTSGANLKPETARTTELIWQHLLGHGLVDATFFNVESKDTIVEIVTPALQRSWANGYTSYRGLELEGQYRWQHWQTRLAATRLFQVNDPANTQSKNLLSGTLSYGIGPWSAALTGSYHSKMTDPNEQNADIRSTEYSYFGGATLWGVHLSWYMQRNLEYYLHGENIFARKVFYPASRAANYAGVPERGRQIMLGLRWSFD